MRTTNLSVVLATFNEEKNLPDCLDSVKDIANEIIIVDGTSKDQTVAIAKKYKAKTLVTDNPSIFHINKQKALDMASYEWILQLDADERVSPQLAKEIKKILNFTNEEIESYQEKLPEKRLFFRHQKLLEERDGTIRNEGSYNAFFVPRLNYFLGRYLRHGGVYPDGVIRLVRKGKAHFPCKDVHEQIAVEGKIGWLQHPLYHYDSPTFARYMQRNKRYIDLFSQELKDKRTRKNLYSMIKYVVVLPIQWFVLAFGRHKGFMDGWQGFVFAFFSALRFPRAYLQYLRKE